jgi:hypothetical protein
MALPDREQRRVERVAANLLDLGSEMFDDEPHTTPLRATVWWAS